ALVWASTRGGRGRWTSVRDRSVKEKQQIWFGIARLYAQVAAEASLLEEYVFGFHRCEKEKKKKCNDRKLADREGRSATTTNG
ncbi:hypothetical protein GW17_00015290, partial [Ensete ventricosum]